MNIPIVPELARNAEKAMTTLARWRAAQVQEAGGQRERRPYLASECNDLPQAEKWRLQIVREIAKKVAQIQNDMGILEPSNVQLSRQPSPGSQREVPPTTDNFETSGTIKADIQPLPSPPRSVKSYQSPIAIEKQHSSQIRTTPNVSSPPRSLGSVGKPSLNLSIKSDKNKESKIELKKTLSPSAKSLSSGRGKEDIIQTIIDLEPQGKDISDHVEELTESIKELTKNIEQPNSPNLNNNIDKIATMSKMLTNEANALRESIKSLSDDISRTKKEFLTAKDEDVNFPYHLFLIELIINKIHMKCECFEFDYNNLVITANFLGKQPIVLYDSSYGKVDDFAHLNVGKSALFAMTYDKICNIKEFVIKLKIVKHPPCSNCVTKVGETRADYTKDFVALREELCKKWASEQPTDNIICTTSTPMSKNIFYVWCGETEKSDSIGVIEISARMSFLGKEITTAFIASPKQQGTSVLQKDDNGMTMYSCQNVELDGQGKVLLDEDSLTRKEIPRSAHTVYSKRADSPVSQFSSASSKPSTKHYYGYRHQAEGIPKYDEIFTKMNANELKIRVPKTTRVERMGKYDKIQEICSCEDTPYNTGEQIQFDLPRDLCYPTKSNNYSTNLKYTFGGKERSCDARDRKIINVTPSNCPVPVNMEKMDHPQKDVFILKIGKKLETKDKKTDLEIELVTPKAPFPVEANNNISQQCSSNEIKKKPTDSINKEKDKHKKKKDKPKSGKAKKKKK
ncbi:Pre-mRNA-splicing factor ISY1-like [Papilio machaon]|uniref:Pre-mRNA-splicing factor ISY1-like n=1 Tax=Papilio machaon TaxID=76193 RepID=A0A194R5V9_PAPMA|nr:Pre-mRNA-splicing factor ISY1-like [Papilio machaon]